MATQFQYRVLFEAEDDGQVHAFAPELPGVHTFGATHAEALANMREAAAAYIEDMLAEGEQPPVSIEAQVTVTA